MNAHSEYMLSAVLDVFRLRQYFNVITRTRELLEGVREDAGFLADAGRAVLPLPDATRGQHFRPFPPFSPYPTTVAKGQRVALVATGGSGALASVVGGGAGLRGGRRPSRRHLAVLWVAMFGFPVAAGFSAEEVAAFVLGLRPDDYLDVGWRELLSVAPTAGRGFAGILRGEAIENVYQSLLGDMTLGEMPIPAYAPIWNVEQNRLVYLGSGTYPICRWRAPCAWPSRCRCSFSRSSSGASTGATVGSSISSRSIPFSTSRNPATSPCSQRLLPARVRGRRRHRVGGSAGEHPVRREPGAHMPADRAGTGKPVPASVGLYGDDDRARSLRDRAWRRFLPTVSEHPELGPVHAGGLP